MSVRYPRPWLQVGGGELMPCIAATVTRTSKRQTDTFSAELSITDTARYGIGLAEWADWDPQDVSILMSTEPDGADLREMISGKVDLPNISLSTMRVSIQGRDRSAALAESKRSEKFQNQKPDEIAKKIAEAHKLTLKFSGNVSDFSGKKYVQDFAHLVLNRTDWETLSSLADQIGYRWYVDGKTLYMEPKTEGDGGFDLVWVPPEEGDPAYANISDLSLRRNMNAARPIQVSVRSWHHRSKKIFSGKANIDGRGDPLTYTDHHNGKEQSQVDKLAKARAREVARHELGITWTGPGDLSADVRQPCNLSGTGTIFDQAYSTEQIVWTMHMDEPFHMVVDATAAKAGRDPDGKEGGAAASPGSGGSTPETQGPQQPRNVPLPPQRPAGLGGGAGAGAGDLRGASGVA